EPVRSGGTYNPRTSATASTGHSEECLTNGLNSAKEDWYNIWTIQTSRCSAQTPRFEASQPRTRLSLTTFSHVIDSYAWIEYFRASPAGERAKKLAPAVQVWVS